MTTTQGADPGPVGPVQRTGTVSPAASSGEAVLPRQRGATPPRARRAYRRLHVTAGVLVLGGIGAAIAVPAGAATQTVTGSVVLWQDIRSATSGEPCTGHGPDADLTVGAPVRIASATGEPLATATLQPGRVDGYTCLFTFLVPDVAKVGGYRIGVGDADRASSAFTYRDMRARSWSVRLAFGA